MARLARLQFEGAIHHVTFRGVERRSIFRHDSDRTRFLEQLNERVADYEIRLYEYCLMSNHVHLLVETPRGNLSAFMGSLLTSYCTYFNRRYRRSGHLLQGRYKSPLVEGDRYLLKLSRYIHLNPVQVRGVKHEDLPTRRKLLRQYPWSSYRSYAGITCRSPFVTYEPLLDLVAGSRRAPERSYRRYVEAGLAESDEELAEALAEGSLAIGSTDFREEMREFHEREAGDRLEREDRAFRKVARTHSAEEVIAEACSHYGVEREELLKRGKPDTFRPLVCMLLQRQAGLSQREIARRMGVGSGAAVCLQIKKYREHANAGMHDALRVIEANLNS